MGDKTGAPRIAVFTKPLDNWKSGSGHHLNEILGAVLDRHAGRFDFTFIHYGRCDNPIYRRIRELVVPRNPILAAATLRRERFDIVHYSPLTIYSPIAGISGRKLATMHGAEQLWVPRFYGKLELAHEILVVPVLARMMDAIVTVSETSAKFFAERYRIDPRKIVVCYNGLSPQYRILDAADITAPARFGIRIPFAFHISKFSERKNPWTLLESFARFSKDRTDGFLLVCAGGGWDNPAVRERVAALGMADRFFAPGFLQEVDVVEFMNAASFFVFPSLAEGFGMPNVEAMACGCPVITSNACAIPEIVGDAAIVVDPLDATALASAMERIVSEPGLREALTRNAKVRLPLFSWEAAADRLIALYSKLAGA
ncbi:MAG: glycosyltransferase family 1 protein [Spirochaetes bacterium]|nr:glycosyltransferase family 1 protein [Spirochaetota bacterium]